MTESAPGPKPSQELIRFLLRDVQGPLRERGAYDLAESLARAALRLPASEVTSEHRRMWLMELATVLEEQGKSEETLVVLGEFCSLVSEELKTSPANEELLSGLAEGLRLTGQACYERRDLPAALSACREALEIRRHLVQLRPDKTEWHSGMAMVFSRLGHILWRKGEYEDALVDHRAAIAIHRRLLCSDPGNLRWREELAWSLNNIALVFLGLGDPEKAVASYREAWRLRELLAREKPENHGYQRSLAWTLGSLGKLLEEQGELGEALALYETCRRIRQGQADMSPGNGRVLRDFAWCLGCLGGILLRLGQEDRALPTLEEAVQIQDRLIQQDPSGLALPMEQSWNLHRMAAIVQRRGDLSRAGELAGMALAARRSAVLDRGDLRFAKDALESWLLLASIRNEAGNRGDVTRLCEECLVALEPWANQSYDPEVMGMHALVLLFVNRMEEANRLITGLLRQGWSHSHFLDLCRRFGIAEPVGRGVAGQE